MSRRKTTAEFVAQSRQIYGDKFDYTPSEYDRNNSSIKIRCVAHNLIFEQTPSNHYLFNGCPKCLEWSQRNRFQKSTEEFIRQARLVHEDRYIYIPTIYINNHKKIVVICRIHGEFLCIPSQHLKGVNCAKCAAAEHPGGYFTSQYFSTRPEQAIKDSILYFVRFREKDSDVSFYKIGVTTDTVDVRFAAPVYQKFDIDVIWKTSGPLQLVCGLERKIKSIYLPNKLKVDYPKFHGATECFSKELPVCKIPTGLMIQEENLDLATSRILVKSGMVARKLHARKCAVRNLSFSEANDFLKRTHIQGGSTRNSVNIGLVDEDGYIVSVMTFGTPRFNKNYQYELIRFSSDLHTIVRGAAGKLFSHFIETFHPKNVISYSDRQWNQNEESVYTILGFRKLYTTSPNYWYVRESVRLSRMKCQKHKLAAILGNSFDPNKSEAENMHIHGFEKIFDQGQDVFSWPPDEN